MGRKNDSRNELVNAIIEEYKPETAKDVQGCLKGHIWTQCNREK